MALMAPLVETLLAAREKPLLKVLEEAFTQMIESESNNDESFLNLSKLGPLLFDVGANPEALALNRKLLYKLSDSIKGATSTKLEVSNSSPANPVEH